MKTLTITREEYRTAVANTVLELSTGDKAEKDTKSEMIVLMIVSIFSIELEAKLFGEDKDE